METKQSIETENLIDPEEKELVDFFQEAKVGFPSSNGRYPRIILHSTQAVQHTLGVLLFLVILFGLGFCVIPETRVFISFIFPVPLSLFCLFSILNCLFFEKLAYAICANSFLCLGVTFFGEEIPSFIFIVASLTSSCVGVVYRRVAYRDVIKLSRVQSAISIREMFLFTLAMGSYFFSLKNQDLVYEEELRIVAIMTTLFSLLLSLTMIQFLRRVDFFKVCLFYLSLPFHPLAIFNLAESSWVNSVIYIMISLTIGIFFYVKNQSPWAAWILSIVLVFIPALAFMPIHFVGALLGAVCFGLFGFVYLLVVLGIPYFFCQFIRDGENYLTAFSADDSSEAGRFLEKQQLGPLDEPGVG